MLLFEANGCLSPPSAVSVVEAVIRPVAAVAFADTTLCEGDMVTLGTQNAGPGLSFSWEGPDFSSDQQFPAVGPLTTFDEGFYYLTVDNNGCVSTPDSTKINIKPKPATPSIESNGPLCVGDDLLLTTDFVGASSYNWVRNGSSQFFTSQPLLVRPSVTLADDGTWEVFVTRNGCTSELSVPTLVQVNPVPNAMAGASQNPYLCGRNIDFKWSTFNQPGKL